MKKELQSRLAEEFVFMKPTPLKNPDVIDDLYGAFGIETGDGWYDLLRNLCGEIAAVLDTAGMDQSDLVIDQIKEKYGTLRFYYHFAGDEPKIQAFDFIGNSGGLQSVRMTPKGEDYKNQISALVRKYEAMSEHICEVCGREGTLRNDLRWIRVLCDDCYHQVLKK